MAPYAKDSFVLVVRATNNGHHASLYLWHENPPPVPLQHFGAVGNPTRIEVIAADKTALKAQLATLVDSIYDQ